MRWLIPLLCLLSAEAWAETLHVCPISAEYGLEDGSSEANCFDGTADVSWGSGAGSVSAGDTLCVHGTFTGSAESDVSGITLRIDTSGADLNTKVTVDGDCDGTGDKAVFDGNDEVAIAIRTAIVTVSRTTYVDVKNIIMRQYTNKAAVTYNVTGDNVDPAYQQWTGIEIYDHGDGGSADNCFDSRGDHIELSDSIISGCDEDGVYHQGANFRSVGLTVSDVSRANSNGDGLQLALYADDYYVERLDCTHSRDAKQCFIASVLTDTGKNGVLRDSTLRCLAGATDQNCAFVTGVGARIERNFTDGGEWGIAVEDSSDSSGMRIVGNITINATEDGIAVFGTTPTGIEITNNTSAFNGDRGIEIVPTNAMTIRNNIVFENTDDGINRAHADQVEQYNDSFGNGGDAYALVGNSTTAGTGSVAVDPDFVGGATPATVADFCLNPTSALVGAGLWIGAYILDNNGHGFANPPNIGGMSDCQNRRFAATRRIAATRRDARTRRAADRVAE